jgi:hypothetical protein
MGGKYDSAYGAIQFSIRGCCGRNHALAFRQYSNSIASEYDTQRERSLEERCLLKIRDGYGPLLKVLVLLIVGAT